MWEGSLRLNDWTKDILHGGEKRISDWLKECLSLSDNLNDDDLVCGLAVEAYDGIGKVYAYIYDGKNAKSYTQALHCDEPIPLKKFGYRTKHQAT